MDGSDSRSVVLDDVYLFALFKENHQELGDLGYRRLGWSKSCGLLADAAMVATFPGIPSAQRKTQTAAMQSGAGPASSDVVPSPLWHMRLGRGQHYCKVHQQMEK